MFASSCTGRGHNDWEKDYLWPKTIFRLIGRTVVARALKSAISILMANNVVVIAVCRGPIMDNMHIKLNAQSAAMFMEQMDRTCMKGVAPNVVEGGREGGRP